MAEQRQVPPAEGEVLVWFWWPDELGRSTWRLVNQFSVERGWVTRLGGSGRMMGSADGRALVVPSGSTVGSAQSLVWAAVTGVE